MASDNSSRELLQRLYTALNRHDHEAMAECYAPDAHFRDIAFTWHKRDKIHDMWRMICGGDVRVTFEIYHADAEVGAVGAIFAYTFGASKKPFRPGRLVCNPTISTFVFREGKILSQQDSCDAKAWARMALGTGPIGFLAGRIRLLRSVKARAKVAACPKAPAAG